MWTPRRYRDEGLPICPLTKYGIPFARIPSEAPSSAVSTPHEGDALTLSTEMSLRALMSTLEA